MKKRVPSISVGIVAFNEGRNIYKCLTSILSQKELGYHFKEIIVISDASQDNTDAEVMRLHSKRITFIRSKKRLGKSTHLNTLFHQAKGDIFVLFDGDVIMATDKTIANLVKPIINNPSVGLVGGNCEPVKATGFVEEAINTTFYAYDKLRITLHGGNNAYGCNGCVLALSKPFFSKVVVPADAIANDAFLFFSARQMGFTFRHIRSAKVWYRSPTTIADHVRQNKRFVASHMRHQKIFGDMVEAEYAVPLKTRLYLMLQQFMKKPIHAIFIYCMNLYCTYRAKKEEKRMNALWEMAYTSKGGIARG